MRYVIVGAGAIGGAVAALLHEAGVEVLLVARGATLEAVRREGVRLTVADAPERSVPVPVVAHLDEVVWDEARDALVLAVKSQQTEALLPALAGVPAGVPVFCLQNGVENERRLLRLRADVHAVVVMMPASSLEPGRVLLHSGGRPGLLDTGRYPTGTDAADEAWARDLGAAGFDVVARPDVMAWKRRKLLLNLGNGVDAAFADSPDADALDDLVRAEGEAVLDAAGLPVVSAAQDRERRGTLLRPLVRRDEAGSSTWQSLALGAGDVETDHLNGEVLLLGRLHGVATPANRLVADAVHRLVRDQGAPRSLDAAAALATLGAARA
ncbi:ketopantoate reductase family protein [Nocardioides bruguierae]|uniref:Ketopantoate reductase family protein n=1 Tax=Nocardioides bruguierae TaxID=2945102 RepID=A0A9X2D5Y9_9ACTN|nr:2-dehydropantoate 2-reductase N-terminal domain-containing protein [Nocardioides bruguierae]MCM0619931.1 ketopantoate reductase family protein [Nocardioides bruguierae]